VHGLLHAAEGVHQDLRTRHLPAPFDQKQNLAERAG
jgi:hypothetical protein